MKARISALASSGASRVRFARNSRCGPVQLADVPPGEGAQERAQRGRRADPAEQRLHRAMPQQVHVIDRIRARGHARGQAGDLQARVRALVSARVDVRTGKVVQPGALDECGQRAPGRRATPGWGHQTTRTFSRAYATIAPARCPLGWVHGSFSNSHYPSSEDTFHIIFAGTAANSPVDPG